MTREQYEQRKQRLDEQLRSGIELLEAAHRMQVRALEMVWSMSAEEDLPSRVPPAEGRPAAPAPAPPQPRRRAAGELDDEVEAALGRLPEEFDRNDLCRVLGYEPERTSLYRILEDFRREGRLSMKKRGSGRVPTVYRKTGAFGPPSSV